ncbi:hypothetical protein MOBT1_002909 [Malassezia obtusa]|uniref:Association with the SNF1 complex (ASC) domain-containing protein n=1 Tax=Malassezia obtusa TaxID=76774 RepID=A0AAF0IUE4_9BASI|nr:hypothetical protein MOBT1_002909 [Malassezia obtusa]
MGNTPSSLDAPHTPHKDKQRAQGISWGRPRVHEADAPAPEKGIPRASQPPEATVTVHRPGHLYSHSISLPSGRTASEDDEGPGVRPAHPAGWEYSERPGVVLAGVSYTPGPPSDTSLVRSQSSLTDSSTQPSDSAYWGSTPESDAESSGRHVVRVAGGPEHSGAGEAEPAGYFPMISTEAGLHDVEPAMKTPTLGNSGQQPNTPRKSEETMVGDVQRTPIPRAETLPGTRALIPHRASLIIDDDAVSAAQELCTSPVSEALPPPAFTPPDAAGQEAPGAPKRRLRTLPSYLRIPTSIPRSFTSTVRLPGLDEASGTPTSLDILRMPMYSGSTTESSGVTAAAPVGDASPRTGLGRTQTAPLLLASPPITERPAGETAAAPAPDAARDAAPDAAAAASAAAAAAAAEPAPAEPAQAEAPPLTPVNLMWRGKGRKVYVTGTFADEWRSKIPLRQLRPNTPFICTLYLPPGTHRLKFIVDDRWRISNELNTASDGEGTLVNYVEIPNTRERLSDEPRAPYTRSDAELRPSDDPRFADPAWASAMDDLRQQQRSASEQRPGEWDEFNDEVPGADVAHWTSEVPPAVEVAQETEEALHEHEMAANAPAILPVPPMLPRQLEKVILNSSPAHAIGSINTTAALVDDNSVLPAPNHAVLHHLAASAIKNGVLAIGTVTRYKRKYVTTLLYRPV